MLNGLTFSCLVIFFDKSGKNFSLIETFESFSAIPLIALKNIAFLLV
ncbi:MAG: hypothetical protein ACI97N_001181 [Cognaticolwellia sp.]|jgi:hypothetical protein